MDQIDNKLQKNQSNSGPLRILFPVGSFYPGQIGGPSNAVFWLSKALNERGHTVYVGTTDFGLEKYPIKTNKWHESQCGNILYQKTFAIFLPLRLILRLIPILKNVDIVHLTSIFYPLSWLMAGWLVLTGNKNKIVWSVCGELYENALSYSPLKKKIILFWLKKALTHRTVFHSASPAETKTIYNSLGKNASVAEHPIYMYLPEKITIPIRKNILFLGRIHPIKALENLITAFSQLENRKGFKLVIVGDDRDAYALALKKLCVTLNIMDDVDFVGHVEGMEKEILLASAYVLILPSHSENFGIVVIEALAQGTPVIASRNTPWEILDEICPGSWVANDPASLKIAMETMINLEEQEYHQIRNIAFDYCRSNFSILDNIMKWEVTYRTILNNEIKIKN